jgi:hypothetical protein
MRPGFVGSTDGLYAGAVRFFLIGVCAALAADLIGLNWWRSIALAVVLGFGYGLAAAKQ